MNATIVVPGDAMGTLINVKRYNRTLIARKYGVQKELWENYMLARHRVEYRYKRRSGCGRINTVWQIIDRRTHPETTFVWRHSDLREQYRAVRTEIDAAIARNPLMRRDYIVLDVVSKLFGIHVDDLLHECRDRVLVHVRGVATIAMSEFKVPQVRISQTLGRSIDTIRATRINFKHVFEESV